MIEYCNLALFPRNIVKLQDFELFLKLIGGSSCPRDITRLRDCAPPAVDWNLIGTHDRAPKSSKNNTESRNLGIFLGYIAKLHPPLLFAYRNQIGRPDRAP